MSIAKRIFQIAAGAAGVAVVGGAVDVARRRAVIARRGSGEHIELGSLHSPSHTVVAEDGVPLHVEIDEAEGGPEGAPTLVFVHGYALNLDCWHFQRAGYRGLIRAVYYDQRSHGRSGRSQAENATIEQLGVDLREVLAQVVPEGPVVLVGHSMGGMSIIALAEAHPELFGDRIVGVALMATTAGGLKPHHVLLPMLPKGFGGQMLSRTILGLSKGARMVEGVRRLSKDFAIVATDRFAFGSDVPGEYVKFVDQMLASTPFDVLAEFFPGFDSLDKFAVLNALDRIPTTILCGTADRLTSVGHSRKMHSLLPHSTLVECEGAGHMVIMERHIEVNKALDELIAAADEHWRDPAG
ncbi:pimeloyl-ACP methyl ester carboxylesterase [Nocardioides daedukensis]|uniref:Pimeloyl-ACP methyl ester carboxylesterase n=1 Tax=Nocardioides daedukensis TaxID=634462 RepID=A0A7Y9UW18_9ACTN|nr:pimeloyl-ACP methyl ester carboxylesterase [Nocardioides daedukensis]